MRAVITGELVRGLPNADVEIRDIRLPGLVLRCRASGRHTYRVQLGRGRWLTLGRAGVLSPDAARQEARIALGDHAKGADPIDARRRKRGHTLKSFLDEVYRDWQVANRKTGAETVARIESVFRELLPLRLGEVSAWHVDRWRVKRREQGLSAATINRDVTALKAAINRAVDWSLLDTSPLTKVRPLRLDRRGVVRYLSDDEEQCLRQALNARDARRQRERESANAWRRERGYPEWPSLPGYTDYLTPLVLLALNTGLRRGELFGLRWADVDMTRAMVTVRGEGAKNAQTRHVPLNAEAIDVVRNWRECAAAPSAGETRVYVFAGAEGDRPLADMKKGWAPVVRAAAIGHFRFHDCRHHFASRLVQAGVDLNTVRELLGHSDMKMVLRYAHLAPENTAAAVAKLVRPGAQSLSA
jgi:integrase